MTSNPPSALPGNDPTMRATEVIAYFTERLGAPSPGGTEAGLPEYRFESPFHFTLTVLAPDRIAITAPLPLPDTAHRAEVLERMLEANLQGAETGPGALCLLGTGRICYRDVFDLSGLDLAGLQLRFIDFSLYFEYWRFEGARLLGLARGDGTDDPGMIRV